MGRQRPGSPPLTRGTLEIKDCPSARIRITPAYAGNIPASCVCALPTWDHPRLRGEHFTASRPGRSAAGSPPLTRGTWRGIRGIMIASGITPAYAGNMKPVPGRPARKWDHPRLRGEHAAVAAGWWSYRDHPRLRGEHLSQMSVRAMGRGSPPLTRGTFPADKQFPCFSGITPAYAGNISKQSKSE